MIFLFADDLDLRLQLNAGDAVYLVLNVFNEPEHIVKACSAAVDDEARVLSLTCAPPTAQPLRPASSMSAAAYPPAGRLNVLPADGMSSGCELLRRSASERIRSRTASGSSSCSETSAPRTMQPVSEKRLCR